MKLGLIGWRGMVGSVLLERMQAEGDFAGLETTFFSTSDAGGRAPSIANANPQLQDAGHVGTLARHDVLISCQGGDYTGKIYPALRHAGWNGIWIDAASSLRMNADSVIILDPVNRRLIDRAMQDGIRTYVGGNCTVSLMLMALSGLFQRGLVEWLSSMTYQAASGAGAANMQELVAQSNFAGAGIDMSQSALLMERQLCGRLSHPDFPRDNFGHPLAYNLLPYIDKPVADGQSREEWKGQAETNKILGADVLIPVDGICVRVSSLRCHAQGFTIKLRRDVPLDEIRGMIRDAHEWVELVENEREASLARLTPAAVTGTLRVALGRMRKMKMGPEYLTAFSVGDQLLWGAAEPLRRMLNIIRGRI